MTALLSSLILNRDIYYKHEAAQKISERLSFYLGEDDMKVLVVEPGKVPSTTALDGSLESMKKRSADPFRRFIHLRNRWR